MLNLVEKNNKLLIKSNEQLNEQITEQKFKHECVIKKFEEEVNFIKEKLEGYKNALNKLNSIILNTNLN